MFEWVNARVPRERLFDVTGIQFLPINTLYQLAAMVAGQDAQLEIADTLLMMPDLLHYWLTGQRGVEYTNASTTQMLDCRKRTWATPLLSELGLPTGLLPALIQPGAVLGTVREAVCRETGLQHGTPVIVPATHDTASAVAAIPGLDAHSAYISSGTWSLMGIETHQPVVNQRALELNITNEGGIGGTIRLLKNINGLWLLQESRRQWQREGRQLTWEQMLAEAGSAAPLASLIDPDAPQFMQPGDLPGAIRSFCASTGQPIPVTVGAMVRCCLESLALKYRMVLQALEDLSGQRIDTVRVVGGGCQNALLCQLTADACGREVVAGPVEATALGNLLMQAIAAGELPDIVTGRQVLAESLELQRYEPRATAPWDEAAGRFEKLLAN
jgi:rhamnulokinase